LLFRLAEVYKDEKEESIASALQEEMVREYLREEQSKQTIGDLSGKELRAVFLSRLGAALIEKGYRDEADALYVRTIDQGPEGSLLWLYYKITKHITENDWEGAFSICEQEIKQFPKVATVTMILSNLCVANGQYDKAVATQINFAFSHHDFQLSHSESILRDLFVHFIPADLEREEATENLLQRWVPSFSHSNKQDSGSVH
jgi:tetratricopeptide (TPR) repeat protein